MKRNESSEGGGGGGGGGGGRKTSTRHLVLEVGGNVGVELDVFFHILQFTQTCRLQSLQASLRLNNKP